MTKFSGYPKIQIRYFIGSPEKNWLKVFAFFFFFGSLKSLVYISPSA